MTNLVDLLYFSLFSSITAGLLTLIQQVISFLLFNTDFTDDYAYSYALGSIISKHGWCSGKHIQPRLDIPSDGWHFLPKYCVIIHKLTSSSYHRDSSTNYSYTIIGFKWQKRRLKNDIIKMCEGENTRDNQIPNLYVDTIPCPWNPSKITRYQDTVDECLWTDEQKMITKAVTKCFLNDSHVSVLVAGDPNTGKSTLADTIASYLLKEHGISATIVHGMNPDNPIYIDFLQKKPSRQNPYIYLINEVDTAVTKALSDKENKKDETTYADNKTKLCNYMDKRSKDNDIITIYTTNEKTLVTDLNNGKNTERNVFFRDGRVDIRYLMTQTIGTNSSSTDKHTMVLRSMKKNN